MVKAKLSTTQRGLGHRHQQAVAQLFEALPAVGDPRNPCAWCGRERYRDRAKNWDYNVNSGDPNSGKLQGDHSTMSRSKALELGVPIPLPDRLLHAECNRQRGDGANDHLAASERGPAATAPSNKLMPWPW